MIFSLIASASPSSRFHILLRVSLGKAKEKDDSEVFEKLEIIYGCKLIVAKISPMFFYSLDS